LTELSSGVLRLKKSPGYQPTFINELSNHNMDMCWQACASLLHTFPMLCSLMNVQYISVKHLEMFISGEKQNPHFFEEVAQHPLHVMKWARIASELIIGPYFFDVSMTC
jgi:hypothetical protein